MTHKIYSMSFARIYSLYIAKVERKNGPSTDVDAIISWLTGYDKESLNTVIETEVDFETFFAQAPKLNSKRKQITGLICGVRVEEIKDHLMQEIRYMDKLIDELAKGRPIDKITPS